MRLNSRPTCALLTGASLLAIGLAAPAVAQEDTTRAFDTIIVTTEKREASIQDVPIAVSAFDETMLDRMNLDGGPDLVLAIPNANFAKGNFTGSNFSLRGIGTKLVSATADAAVGVHVNGAPLTANRLFEAEFYDSERIEVLRGPQGTLYGRNSTGGVINVITAKPTDVFEGSADLTYGSENTIKARGFVNFPIGDTAGLRLAGYYHSRDGYVFNDVTGNDVDDRNLYSLRATFSTDLWDRGDMFIMVEHFEEDSTRLRASEQLCTTDPTPTSIGGVPITPGFELIGDLSNQGCIATPIDNKTGVVNATATLGGLLGALTGLTTGNVFEGATSGSLRATSAAFDPIYEAEQTLFEIGINYDLTDELTLSLLTSYNEDRVLSNEDYTKVTPNTTFNDIPAAPFNILFPGGVVNDPQLGSSDLFRTYDVSLGDSSQFTQEVRLQSDFDGRANFTVGGIYIDFETITDYYVLSNTLTANAQIQNFLAATPPEFGGDPNLAVPVDPGNGSDSVVANLNDNGRNYFLSRTPYELEAYALFGEGYFDLSDDVKLTVGLRYTNDDKQVVNNSTTLLANVGDLPLALTEPTNAFLTDPINPVATTQFEEVTGRVVLDWQTRLPGADESLVYASYSRGYKGGGVNPPPAVGVDPIAPTYDPEFINAYEIGTKSTYLQGALQLNLTGFYYDYEGYQVSQIVNRTSLNENIDAEVLGLEFESIWSPVENLVFNANIGLLDTEITGGESIDVIDRTQGADNQIVIKAADASNCVVPEDAYGNLVAIIQGLPGAPVIDGVTGNPLAVLGACDGAFAALGVTPSAGTPVNLEGKELPNAPGYTISLGAQYTWDIGTAWSITARGDWYRQDASWSRIYNSVNDRLSSWENVNASITFNNSAQDLYVELYVQNLFDDTVIQDAYLTDDSSGLFTNVFLNDPRIVGVTVGKRF